MTIEKNGKNYFVKENTKSWTLSITIGCVPVSYNISKADCPTLESLKAFVAENTLF
jgi:hypothetical protein